MTLGERINVSDRACFYSRESVKSHVPQARRWHESCVSRKFSWETLAHRRVCLRDFWTIPWTFQSLKPQCSGVTHVEIFETLPSWLGRILPPAPYALESCSCSRILFSPPLGIPWLEQSLFFWQEWWFLIYFCVSPLEPKKELKRPIRSNTWNLTIECQAY